MQRQKGEEGWGRRKRREKQDFLRQGGHLEGAGHVFYLSMMIFGHGIQAVNTAKIPAG